MRIGEIARRAGIATSRIRFYERQGVLPAAARTENGYRDYPESMVDILCFIERAQAFGFSLREIAPALPALDAGALAPAATIPALERKLSEVNAHIAAAIDLRKRLLELIEEQKQCEDSRS